MDQPDPSLSLFQALVDDVQSLTEKERLVGAYLSVRDIPYGSANTPTPFDVLARNRGTAKGKHLLLKLILTTLGYEVRHMWAKHDFSKLPIHPWPEALAEFQGEHTIGFHDFLRVKIGGRFVTVDATYDKQPRDLGFPVQEWDGASDMQLPVHAEETFPVEGQIDEQRRGLVAALPKDMQDRRKKFLKTLKRWLETERQRADAASR